MNSDQDFSFLQLNALINKQFIHQDKEHKTHDRPRLKFEPNVNIKRKYSASLEHKEKEVKAGNIIDDIAKNFEGETSLIKKAPKETHSKQLYNVDDSKKQVPIEVKLKKEKKTKTSDFGLATAINKIKEKDPQAYIPIILPFKDSTTVTNDEVENCGNILKNEEKTTFDEDNLFLVQFPRQIPVNSDIQEKAKYEETTNEEPTYDSKGYLVTPEFKNIFQELPKNSPIGKLKLYKSGKVKMQIGEVLFDVIPGVNMKFAQEMACITNEQSNQAYLLGKLKERKLIAIPELI